MPEEDVLRVEIRALRSEMEQRDRLYTERDLASKAAVAAALAAAEKQTLAAFLSGEKAVAVAQANAEKWRDAANEWRGTMNDKDEKFALKTEIVSLVKQIDELKNTSATMTGAAGGVADARNGARANLGALIGLAGFVLAVVLVLLKNR